MTITIPIEVIWALGIITSLIILGLAIFGGYVLLSYVFETCPKCGSKIHYDVLKDFKKHCLKCGYSEERK